MDPAIQLSSGRGRIVAIETATDAGDASALARDGWELLGVFQRSWPDGIAYPVFVFVRREPMPGRGKAFKK